jgi:hypothetical protein
MSGVVSVIRAGWTSSSFLAYTGALTVLAASIWLESILSGDYGSAAFVGWSALVFGGAAVCALGFRLAARPLLAGLFAFVSVALFGVFVGALESWFGWLPKNFSPLGGFHWGLLLLELVILIAALWALRWFRHPLLVLAAAGVGWYFVADLLSSGGNWSAWVSILYGLCLLPAALSMNRVYGFWLNVVCGLTIGGGLLWFWHVSDWDFVLIALVGLLYVFFGGAARRSSWAVLGAFGLLLTTVHFVDKWFGSVNPINLLFGLSGSPKHDWARPLGFVVLGFVYVALGIVLRRREHEPAPAPPTG